MSTNPTTDPALGMEIGSYKVVDVLGKGGMGVVYKAIHPGIGKKVAVKLLNAKYSSEPETVMRFFREAKAVNDIHHENVIDVIDFGKLPSGECYIIMEYLDGKPLSASMKGENKISLARFAHISLQVCSALAAAHQKGIIHRDLKPDNIFLINRSAKPDFAKLLDFGIAKLLYDDSVPLETGTGAIIGTPMYMSPEQVTGKPIDHQSDIYSLGIVFYQMLTGAAPFYDTNPITMAMHHLTKEAKPPRETNPEIPAALNDLILRCIAKEKSARFQDMQEVARAIGVACGVDPAPYLALIPTDSPETNQNPSESASISYQETRGPGQTNEAKTREASTSPALVATMAASGRPPGMISPKDSSPAALAATMAPAAKEPGPQAAQETLNASAGEVSKQPKTTASMLPIVGALVGVVFLGVAVFASGILNKKPIEETQQVTAAPSLPTSIASPKEEPASTPLATSSPASQVVAAPTKEPIKKTPKKTPKATTPGEDDPEEVDIPQKKKNN